MENEQKLRNELKQFCNDKTLEYVGKWIDLKEYLQAEFTEGKTEFRLAFQSDKAFIIHPMGKDGKTLDMTL